MQWNEKPPSSLIRPRRLREKNRLRQMVRETRISASSFVLPVFVQEGENKVTEIPSLPGQFRYSPDRVCEIGEKALENHVASILLFGVPSPDRKDECGSEASRSGAALQEGIRRLKERFPELYLITDVCMCEYTSHGHCGILNGAHNGVDNEKTLPHLAKIALSHAQAGADMVAPSDMMDGRVRAIRAALDEQGFEELPILSYAVKYASAFYGPFREAVGSAPSFGDRRGYQMDCHNKREALKEALQDVEEGADLLMVKPALAYLDVIQTVKEHTLLPLAAYSVSGEYAMIKAAASQGLIEERQAVLESAVGIFRAGADLLISYYALELADAVKKGEIG